MIQRAFTLIEILVVVAIIGIILAITLPVLSRAKDSGHRVSTLSNLRQSALALHIYASDNGDYPIGEGADELFANVPTCDREDDWRASCDVPSERPLAGSFGYVRYVDRFEDPDGWRVFRDENPNGIVLVSIFHGEYPIKKFSGMTPDYPACLALMECIYPNKRLVARMDGSASVIRHETYIEEKSKGIIFTWESAFDDDPNPIE